MSARFKTRQGLITSLTMLVGLAVVAAALPSSRPLMDWLRHSGSTSGFGQSAHLQDRDLTGHLTRSMLDAVPGWAEERNGYTPDPVVTATIGRLAANVDMTLFIGTWSQESQQEAPRILKIVDDAGLPESTLSIVGLDKSRKDDAGLADKWRIESVPTLLLSRGEQELGRVVGRPTETPEDDIAHILVRGTTPTVITAQDVRALLALQALPLIVDTRLRSEYEAQHIPGALSRPFSGWNASLAELPRDRTIVLYCWGGT